jgi:hypothetical protein
MPGSGSPTPPGGSIANGEEVGRTACENVGSANKCTFRPYAPGDEAAINRGFNEVFGLQRPLQEWEWKFAALPEGRWILVAVDPRGEVVAHYGAVPVRFQVDGEVLRAGQPVDVFCLRRPDLVHAMVFVRLVREFYRVFGGPERLALLFGFPSERPLRLGKAKMSYGDPAPVPVWRRGTVGRRSWWTRHAVKPGLDAAAADRLWQRSAARYPVATVRDGTWLQRRYTGRPGVEYAHLSAWKRGEVHAWAVLRLLDGVARWVDLVWDGEDPRALAALDDAAGRLARRWGAAEIEMWLANDAAAEVVFSARDWASTPHPQVKLTALSFQPGVDGNDVVRRYYLTMGDSDLV